MRAAPACLLSSLYWTLHIKGQRTVVGRVACVVVPPCKGLRSLAAIARSRLLRWALQRLRLPLSTGAPYGLVLKVGAFTKWGYLLPAEPS